jgi:hypothetical protein
MYNVELHTKIETYLRKYEQENKPKKNEK